MNNLSQKSLMLPGNTRLVENLPSVSCFSQINSLTICWSDFSITWQWLWVTTKKEKEGWWGFTTRWNVQNGNCTASFCVIVNVALQILKSTWTYTIIWRHMMLVKKINNNNHHFLEDIIQITLYKLKALSLPTDLSLWYTQRTKLWQHYRDKSQTASLGY